MNENHSVIPQNIGQAYCAACGVRIVDAWGDCSDCGSNLTDNGAITYKSKSDSRESSVKNYTLTKIQWDMLKEAVETFISGETKPSSGEVITLNRVKIRKITAADHDLCARALNHLHEGLEKIDFTTPNGQKLSMTRQLDFQILLSHFPVKSGNSNFSNSLEHNHTNRNSGKKSAFHSPKNERKFQKIAGSVLLFVIGVPVVFLHIAYGTPAMVFSPMLWIAIGAIWFGIKGLIGKGS